MSQLRHVEILRKFFVQLLARPAHLLLESQEEERQLLFACIKIHNCRSSDQIRLLVHKGALLLRATAGRVGGLRLDLAFCIRQKLGSSTLHLQNPLRKHPRTSTLLPPAKQTSSRRAHVALQVVPLHFPTGWREAPTAGSQPSASVTSASANLLSPTGPI